MNIENPPPGSGELPDNEPRPSQHASECNNLPFKDATSGPAETFISATDSSALDHQPSGPEPAEQSEALAETGSVEAATHLKARQRFSLEQFTLPAGEVSEASARRAIAVFVREYDAPVGRFPAFTDSETVLVDNQATQRWKMELQYRATNGLVILEPADGELNVKHIVNGNAVETRRYSVCADGIRCDSRDHARLLHSVPEIGDAPAEMRWHETMQALQGAEPERAVERELGLNDQLVGEEEIAYLLHILDQAEPRIVGCRELLTVAHRRAASPYAPHPTTRRLTLDAFVAGVHDFARTQDPDYNFRRPFEIQSAANDTVNACRTEFRVSQAMDEQYGLIPTVEARFIRVATPNVLAAHGIDTERLAPHTQTPRLSTGIQLTVQDKRVVYTTDQRIDDRGYMLKKWPPSEITPADYDLARLVRNFLRAPRALSGNSTVGH